MGRNNLGKQMPVIIQVVSRSVKQLASKRVLHQCGNTWRPGNWLISGFLSQLRPVLAENCVLGQLYSICASSNYKFLQLIQGFPGGSDGKASACNTGDPDSIPGSGRSPGEGNGSALPYFCLKNSMNTGAWQSMGSQRVRPDWATNTLQCRSTHCSAALAPDHCHGVHILWTIIQKLDFHLFNTTWIPGYLIWRLSYLETLVITPGFLGSFSKLNRCILFLKQ